jgi:signal transduction histidine kinase
LPEPIDDTINPIDPATAERQFLEAYEYFLMGMHLPDGQKNADNGQSDYPGKAPADVVMGKAENSALANTEWLEYMEIVASSLTHKINNPITGVLNYSQLISNRLEPGNQLIKFADSITRESERIAEIVRGLGIFSQHDTQQPRSVRYTHVMNSVLSLQQETMKKDHVSTVLQAEPDLPRLTCQSSRIKIVITCLLDNAREALNERYPGSHPDKTILISIHLKKLNGHTYLRTTIEDHGKGISPQHASHVFTPFFSTKPRRSGLGLGLSISHVITAEHGGSLSFESKAGAYSRFHLDLPLTSEHTSSD